MNHAPWVKPRLERAARLALEDAPAIAGLATRIAPLGLDADVRARLLLEAVQGMTRYQLDRAESRRPLEVWARGVGDCADSAPLLAALALGSGIPARLVYIPGARVDHLSCQLWVGGRWCWAEPTLVGAELGEEPTAAAGRLRVRGRADLR